MSDTALHQLFGPFFYQGQLVPSPALYHYVPGSTTAKTAWKDYNKNLTAENPIMGDANGIVSGYFDGLYKIEVRTHDGVTVLGQWDNVLYDPSTEFDVFGNRVLFASDYDSIKAALDAAGTSLPTTIIVTEPTTITNPFTLATVPTIHWNFFGSGRLVPAGVSVTLYSPETIGAEGSQHCLDASNGAITFAKPGKVYAGWFGVKSSVNAPSVAFVQDAIDSLPQDLAEVEGGEVALGGGDYLWDDTLVVDQDRFILSGAGIGSTRIICTMIGKPGIRVSGERVLVRLRDFWLEGNGLTGGSGNGHGISMLDPTPDTGAFAPQQCTIERVQVIGFKGTDSDGRGGRIIAAGIAQVSTLSIEIRNCRLDSNGIGSYIESCYTPRLYDNMIIDNSKYGLMVVGTSFPIENLMMRGNDILNNGDGGTYAQIGWASAPTGNVYLQNVEGVDLSGNKMKNGNLANLMLHFCYGVNLAGDWIRADHKYGAYIRNSNGVVIEGVNFDLSVSSTNAGEYLLYEMTDGNDSRGMVLKGCRFRAQAGKNATYFVKVLGDSSSRKFIGFEMVANVFGETNAGSAVTVTDAIKFQSVSLKAGIVARNSLIATANVTITNGIHTDVNTTIGDTVRIEDNDAETSGGGAITNPLLIDAGTLVQELRGTGTPEGTVAANIGSRFARKNGGSGTSLYVKESGTGNTGWVGK